MPNSSSSQRDDVARKYAVLYDLMARVISVIVDSAEIPFEKKFEFAKNLMPGVWWGWSSGRLESKMVTPEMLQTLAMEYNAMPYAWKEWGLPIAQNRQAYYRAEEAFSRDMVLKYMPADCDLVLDLGCGWGHRLFDLWRGQGPQQAIYAGGDRPAASQICIASLAGLFPGMNVGGFPFDFLKPDFASLPTASRSVLVYTNHTIEQVERLGTRLFDALIGTFAQARITCVHLEPASFQIPGAEAANPEAFARDRSYAAQRRYNQDLYAQVVSHRGLKLVTAVPSILDTSGGNSTALIVWERRLEV
ncbi:MAG: hypothetical protein ACYCZX_06625 [Rhodospirillaceae bacterium]